MKQKNNNLSKIDKDTSSKIILFKANPTTPNINNIKQTNIDININISLNTNIETSEKYTQTEEIFFKKNWSYFIGMYKILTPKIDKYLGQFQLKPIKFNAIKNSYSFTNKKEIILNNSIVPSQQTIDLSQPKREREYKILNMMKSNKFNFDNFNLNLNKKNRNSSMIPFGPLYNNLMEKNENNEKNRQGYFSNANKVNAINLKNLKIINYPVVKSKGIYLKKIADKKEN